MEDPALVRTRLFDLPPGGVRDVDARRLLAGSTRAVLERLADGDPLELRRIVATRLRARARLLDADQVHLRALALVARAGNAWSGRPKLDGWLAERVDRAIDEVRRELCGDADAGAFRQLAGPLGLTVEQAREAAVAFDGRPAPERRAFFRLVLEGAGLDDAARAEGTDASTVGKRARRALDATIDAVQASAPRQPERTEEEKR